MRISVVVLNYRTADLTLQCLESIQRAENRNRVELILVDNGSSPTEHNSLVRASETRGIRIDRFVRLASNLGFSQGMNAGIDVATGDLIVALNSDTLMGRKVPTLLANCGLPVDDNCGFVAVSVYNAALSAGSMRPTSDWQADVTALTWYISCLPARACQLDPSYILGPPGSAVVMTRELVTEMISRYGFVYDPNFFLYGEDVDLFLRARRGGFRTIFAGGNVDHEDVIWHVGSASSGMRTLTLSRSPEIASHVLSGCLRNALRHASVIEIVPLLLLQLVFRAAFCILYARRRAWRSVLRVAVALPFGRSYGRSRGWKMFLCPAIAVVYRKPALWARARVSV